ncbi:hypothetical protein CAEBREN_22543 [Caenorhabditis brenneri]|uniref:Sdz-33 F-box domain-containing protein n=1 Tax=Caenorhabditis brenneri TaxID=135651 RepID=G0PI16_CAEBE|nr:hypothetical protein CAEBREN_22543 [Caenorhabditis brenneri]
MSLSCPVRFPLLKLPFLCIEAVVKSLDIFVIIFFALSSRKTRQIVKHLKIPLNGIKIFLSYKKWIKLASLNNDWFFEEEMIWFFEDYNEADPFFDEHQCSRRNPLVLQNNAVPLYTSTTHYSLKSYTDGNEVIPLKLAMEFLNEVFKCSVEEVNIDGDNFPESGDIGVRSAMNLRVTVPYINSHAFGQIQNLNRELNLLLENLQVTGTCSLHLNNKKNGFYVDPKLFKCKRLVFSMDSGAWVTREILLQFEVPQLKFEVCPFSVEDILSFVIQWFHSDNQKLEYLFLTIQDMQISFENFQTEELKPVPCSERNRAPS